MYGGPSSMMDCSAGWTPLDMTGNEKETATVYVVDDDVAVRRSFETLMRAVGLKVRTFPSAAEYLAAHVERPACLVLDIRMPGIDGFELQKRIAGTERDLPVIVITGEEEEEVRLRSLEAGAIAFFYKPFDDAALMEAIYRAIEVDS